MQPNALPKLAATMALAALVSPNVAHGQSAEEFYRGNQIRLIVGAPAGDGFDTWSRLIARYMESHVPGKPSIVVQNMPGAGTMTAANYLYNIAPKDGTVFGAISRNLPPLAVVGQSGVQYDPRRFGWIGSPEIQHRVCIAGSKAQVKTAGDLFTKELIVGGTGSNSPVSYFPKMLDTLLGMKFRVVDGYQGSQEIFLAMERGEVNGMCMGLAELKAMVDSGKAAILFNTEADPLADYPGVPTIYRFTRTEEQRKIIEFTNAALEFGRPYVTPPDVPKDRLAALQKAFEAALKDPGLLSDAARLTYDVTLTSGDDLQKLAQHMYSTPKDIIDKAVALMPQ